MEMLTIKNVRTTTLVRVLNNHPDWRTQIETYWTQKTKVGFTNVETLSKEIYKSLKKELEIGDAISEINDIWGRMTSAVITSGTTVVEIPIVASAPKEQIVYTEEEVEALIYKMANDRMSNPIDFWEKNKKK